MTAKLFAAFCTLGLMTAVASNLWAGLVWHSALNGDATALVGSDGVATGTPTPTPDMNANPGGAVLFTDDADKDYFTVTPAVSSFMAGSISAWVRPDVVDGSEDGVVAVGASGGGSDVYFSLMNRNDRRWRVDLDDGNNRRDVLSDAAPTAGTWYHMVVAFDSNAGASEQLRMYVDNVLQSDSQSIAGDNDPYNPTYNWLIGTERTNGRYFTGAIDDVRIYDHELSALEMTTLFEDGPLFVEEQLIPEPSTLVLAVAGLLCLAFYGWRRCKT